MFLINKFKFLLYGFLFAENGEGGFYIYNFIFIIQRGGDLNSYIMSCFRRGILSSKFISIFQKRVGTLKLFSFGLALEKQRGIKLEVKYIKIIFS